MKEPVGQMVYDIASNKELLKRIQDFFHSHRDKPSEYENLDPEGAVVPEKVEAESSATGFFLRTTSLFLSMAAVAGWLLW